MQSDPTQIVIPNHVLSEDEGAVRNLASNSG